MCCLGSPGGLVRIVQRTVEGFRKGHFRTPPSDRHAKKFGKLEMFSGVGALMGMVFLTEMGDLNRFANRRQFGAGAGHV